VEAPGYLRVFDRLNPFLVPVLASPFHWLVSWILVQLTITGRKSGRRYTIPVAYHEFGDAIVVMVADAANRSWWRNFREPGPIDLRHRGRAVSARARVLPAESAEFRQRVEQVFGRARALARMFGIRFDPVLGLTAQQAEALGEYAVVVLITLDAAAAEATAA
jgi:deazaflavin-dependent oxidoreductase (nitroreductase family)